MTWRQWFRERKITQYKESIRPLEVWKQFHKADIEPITPDHRDPNLAQIHKDFEALLDHRLVAAFKRNKIHLWMWNAPLAKTPLEKFNQHASRPMETVGMKDIIIPGEYLEIFSKDEIKAALAHELGHLLQCYEHPKHRQKTLSYHDAEFMADQISAVLLGSGDSLQRMLTKSAKHNIELARQLENTDPQFQGLEGKIKATEKASTEYHPSLQQRLERISTIDMTQAEQALSTQLDKMHRAIFPSQSAQRE